MSFIELKNKKRKIIVEEEDNDNYMDGDNFDNQDEEDHTGRDYNDKIEGGYNDMSMSTSSRGKDRHIKRVVVSELPPVVLPVDRTYIEK